MIGRGRQGQQNAPFLKAVVNRYRAACRDNQPSRRTAKKTANLSKTRGTRNKNKITFAQAAIPRRP
jgi:hypothetical protein